MAQTADITSLLAHADWLRALARRLVGTGAGADDAVQDTYVAALRSPPPADRPARPWLARVLRNATRMGHRGATRRAQREDAVAVATATATAADASSSTRADDAVARVDTFRILVELVLKLDEPLRATLVQHYFDGDSLAEIARRDGIPDGTVRWRHKQAVDKLREALDARSGGDRRAWLAALAPLATAPVTAGVTGTAGAGAIIANKLLVAAAVAVAAGGVATWQIVRHAEEPSAPAAAAGGAGVSPSPSAAAAGSPAAPSAPAPVRHVRQLSPADRSALAAQIASAHARRDAAHGATPPPSLSGRTGAVPMRAADAPEEPAAPLDKDTIRSAMREVIPFVTQCYEDAMPTLPPGVLQIQAHFTITGDPDIGSVIDAKQIFDDDNHPLPAKFDDCLRSTFQTLELPPLGDGESMKVDYPFIFAPAASGSGSGSDDDDDKP